MANEESSQFNVQGYNIVTILKRLEAATSRLEDISAFQNRMGEDSTVHSIADGDKQAGSNHSANAVVGGSGTFANAASTNPALDAQLPASIGAYDSMIDEFITPWVKESCSIDPQVGECATLFRDAFKAEVALLKIASESAKPDMSDPAFAKLLEPINERVGQIISIKDKNRPSKFFNHLNTVAEGSPVLGWVVTETPVSFVGDSRDSAKFWSDRVLKDCKDQPDNGVQVAWVSAFMDVFDQLKKYVKEHATKGLVWNSTGLGRPLAEVLNEQGAPTPSGVSVTPAKSKSSTSTASGATGGPPPPPPPPPSDFLNATDGQDGKEGGMTAVFADLNQGADITKGLKKVDKSQMTHKNPELRNKKPLPPKKPAKFSSTGGTPSNATASSSTTTSPPKKQPRVELVDNKWMIEGQYDCTSPIVIEAERHQSVFIGHCDVATVQIKGKANAISISETKSVGLVVDSLISGIDVIKSEKFGLQVMEVVPTIYVDKCDQGTLYVSQASIDADIKIYTSCSTSVNINVPKDDDYSELAVPEQLEHRIENGKLVTGVVEHAG
ncbi:adenylyl cyclase-associated protein [Diutina catenulata]